jgi:hypothetical protein
MEAVLRKEVQAAAGRVMEGRAIVGLQTEGEAILLTGVHHQMAGIATPEGKIAHHPVVAAAGHPVVDAPARTDERVLQAVEDKVWALGCLNNLIQQLII